MNTPVGGGSKLAAAAMLVALLAMSAACEGGLWLAVPSLAYQSYKYESGDHQESQDRQHQNTQPPADDQVE
ncbi:MAG TPA: hypothetical protein VMI09_13780 [Candidatus Binataceae bacterium]|nr:hypothetical protein [Candidatus Binataceae bacterium]